MGDRQAPAKRSTGPQVTVVTPSFNQASFIEETIRSVLLQDYPRVEYFIFDGGSTDGSVDIIKKYEPWLAGWGSEPDKGQADAINKGFRRASGEVLAWLNSDDLYTPGALAIGAAIFERCPEIDFIYSDWDVLEEPSGTLRREHKGELDLRRLLTKGLRVSQPTVFLRRSLLDRIGLLDESLHLALDYHLSLRAFAHGRTLYVQDAVLARGRTHPLTKSSVQRVEFPREFLRAVDLFYSLPDLPMQALRLKRQAYSYHYYVLADVAISVERDWAAGLAWLMRSVIAYPPVLLGLPRALVHVLSGTREKRWRVACTSGAH
jgi:GT2 family glycosyltransferase